MQRMGEKKKVKYVEMATGHHNGVLMDIYSHSRAALAAAMTETISHEGTEESLGMYEYGSGCIYKISTSAYTKNGFAFQRPTCESRKIKCGHGNSQLPTDIHITQTESKTSRHMEYTFIQSQVYSFCATCTSTLISHIHPSHQHMDTHPQCISAATKL